MLAEIMDARQEDVVFIPQDPHALDEYAVSLEERNLSWTLGHVIVHTTASAEESAALSSVLARGIPLTRRIAPDMKFHGRRSPPSSSFMTGWRKAAAYAAPF